MLPDVMITVREKIAQVSGSPEIVCGNSDYAVVFDLDSEWDSYDVKTMRVAWLDVRTGKLRYDDVPFSGSTCVLPAIYDAYEIAVGIYAGDIRTTTPARIPCARCITDGGLAHEPPPPDVYAQILDLLEKIAKPVGFGATGDATMMRDGAGIGIVGNVDIVDLLKDPYLSSLQNVAVNTSGETISAANRICCTEFVAFPSGFDYFFVRSSISGTAAQHCVWLYDENGDYLDSETNTTDSMTEKRYNQYTESGAKRTIPENAAKMRIVTRLSSNADIDVSSLTAFYVMFG